MTFSTILYVFATLMNKPLHASDVSVEFHVADGVDGNIFFQFGYNAVDGFGFNNLNVTNETVKIDVTTTYSVSSSTNIWIVSQNPDALTIVGDIVVDVSSSTTYTIPCTGCTIYDTEGPKDQTICSYIVLFLNSLTFVVENEINCEAFAGLFTLPTYEPTPAPTAIPSNAPTNSPSSPPTAHPTDTPSSAPTNIPSSPPTAHPTDTPSNAPTNYPTDIPIQSPTNAPSIFPTNNPTTVPFAAPTEAPVQPPTNSPTRTPTSEPSNVPTFLPNGDGSNALDDIVSGDNLIYVIIGGVALIILIVIVVICYKNNKDKSCNERNKRMIAKNVDSNEPNNTNLSEDGNEGDRPTKRNQNKIQMTQAQPVVVVHPEGNGLTSITSINNGNDGDSSDQDVIGGMHVTPNGNPNDGAIGQGLTGQGVHNDDDVHVTGITPGNDINMNPNKFINNGDGNNTIGLSELRNVEDSEVSLEEEDDDDNVPLDPNAELYGVETDGTFQIVDADEKADEELVTPGGP